MALTFLTRSGYVVVEDGAVRLAPKGRSAQEGYDRLHAEVEQARFGAGDVRRLRSSLQRVLADPGFAQGLEPHSGGWRAEQALHRAHERSARGPDRAAAPLSDGAAPRRLARRQLTPGRPPPAHLA